MAENVTMKISGMMCMHCENRVKKVLSAMDGVEVAKVSHEEGLAELNVNGVADADLSAAVNNLGFKVDAITR